MQEGDIESLYSPTSYSESASPTKTETSLAKSRGRVSNNQGLSLDLEADNDNNDFEEKIDEDRKSLTVSVDFKKQVNAFILLSKLVLCYGGNIFIFLKDRSI